MIVLLTFLFGAAFTTAEALGLVHSIAYQYAGPFLLMVAWFGAAAKWVNQDHGKAASPKGH